MMKERHARFAIGEVVKHRFFPFRGIIFDVDPEFNNTEEWWLSIPEEMPRERPALLSPARGKRRDGVCRLCLRADLLPDDSGEPLRHPQLGELFDELENGGYRFRGLSAN